MIHTRSGTHTIAPDGRFDRIHSWDGDVALDQSDCLNRANSGEKRTG
jgi:hypothetical protein